MLQDRKNTIITLWLGGMALLVLLFFLPGRAENYFLSLRMLNNEKKAALAEVAAPRNFLHVLRNEKDDARRLQLVVARADADGRWFLAWAGVIILGINVLACSLYMFDMRPLFIIMWAGVYSVIAAVLVLRSYIAISP